MTSALAKLADALGYESDLNGARCTGLWPNFDDSVGVGESRGNNEPPRERTARIEAAIAVCGTCPVVAACERSWRREVERGLIEPTGVWAGRYRSIADVRQVKAAAKAERRAREVEKRKQANAWRTDALAAVAEYAAAGERFDVYVLQDFYVKLGLGSWQWTWALKESKATGIVETVDPERVGHKRILGWRGTSVA